MAGAAGCLADRLRHLELRTRFPAEAADRPFEVHSSSTPATASSSSRTSTPRSSRADSMREFALILTHPKLCGATGAWSSPIALISGNDGALRRYHHRYRRGRRDAGEQARTVRQADPRAGARGFLPRESENWDSQNVFNTSAISAPNAGMTRTAERCARHVHITSEGTPSFTAALFRLRERDFEKVQHVGGVSPEWPLKYRDFEPYYAEAEKLYQVHGQSGLDPPSRRAAGSSRIRRRARAAHPGGRGQSRAWTQPVFHAARHSMNEAQKYPANASAADLRRLSVSVRRQVGRGGRRCAPAMGLENVTLRPRRGRAPAHEFVRPRDYRCCSGGRGRACTFTADVVVVACGSINSAALLLKSANDNTQTVWRIAPAWWDATNGAPGLRGDRVSSLRRTRPSSRKHFHSSITTGAMRTSRIRWARCRCWARLTANHWKVRVHLRAARHQLCGQAFARLVADQRRSADPNNRITLNRDGHIVVDYTENNTPASTGLAKRKDCIGCGCHAERKFSTPAQ